MPEPVNGLISGLDPKALISIYGAPGTGKTNLCLLAAADCIKKGGRVVYVDTEGGISVERFQGTGSKVWDEYIKTLPDVCPYLPGGGYSPSIAIGIFINPGDPVVVDDCLDESELTL